MNKVVLMGRLTRDPDVRHTQGEKPLAIARFTLAVDRNLSVRENRLQISLTAWYSENQLNLLKNTSARVCLLFQKVKCSAYVKRIYDGKYIQVFQKNETESGQIEACYMEGLEESQIQCEMDDDYDFLKTYYERQEKEFSGFVVGFKEIVTRGYLTIRYEEPEYYGERVVLGKYPKEIVKCAIVYYADNKKRFVPVEDLEL